MSHIHRPWNLIDKMDTLAREMLDAWMPFPSDRSLVPCTEIYEEKDQLVMKAELRGIDKKDLDILRGAPNTSH
jgi:HSP20 family molecular chaperone IbpA